MRCALRLKFKFKFYWKKGGILLSASARKLSIMLLAGRAPFALTMLLLAGVLLLVLTLLALAFVLLLLAPFVSPEATPTEAHELLLPLPLLGPLLLLFKLFAPLEPSGGAIDAELFALLAPVVPLLVCCCVVCC